MRKVNWDVFFTRLIAILILTVGWGVVVYFAVQILGKK